MCKKVVVTEIEVSDRWGGGGGSGGVVVVVVRGVVARGTSTRGVLQPGEPKPNILTRHWLIQRYELDAESSQGSG